MLGDSSGRRSSCSPLRVYRAFSIVYLKRSHLDLLEFVPIIHLPVKAAYHLDFLEFVLVLHLLVRADISGPFLVLSQCSSDPLVLCKVCILVVSFKSSRCP